MESSSFRANKSKKVLILLCARSRLEFPHFMNAASIQYENHDAYSFRDIIQTMHLVDIKSHSRDDDKQSLYSPKATRFAQLPIEI